jgi:hypothetical protein
MAATVQGRPAERRAAWLAADGTPKASGTVPTKYVSAVCADSQPITGAALDVLPMVDAG